MTVCPKCGRKLKLTNVSQYCPGCGVNVRFYGFEDKFFLEAKQAELAFASLHIKLRHFKAAFLGNRLTKVRIFSAFIPIISLLVPTAYFTLTLPYYKFEASFGLLGLIQLFSGDAFSYIMNMTGASVGGSLFLTLRNAVFAEVSIAVFAVLILLLSLLCFLSVKHMQKIICAVSVSGMISAAAAAVFAGRFCSAASSSELTMLSGSMGYGYIISIVCFAVVFSVNLAIAVRGIKIEYEEGDLERAEIAGKVKAGLLKIEELPQPVVQTSATRLIEDEIAKERKAFAQKYGSDADEIGPQEENV